MDQRLSDADADNAADGAAAAHDGRAEVERFGRASRAVHWLMAAPFLLLLLTGLTNFYPSLKAMEVTGGRLFAWIHVLLGFATLAAMVLLVLPLLLRRSVRDDLREMVRVGFNDYLWFQHQALSLIGARSRPPRVRKFNAGQKLNSLLSLAATVALMGTGVIIGINFLSKEVFSARFVEDVFPWHTAISLLVIPLVLGHLYLSLIHPSTRESLRGITLGRVRRDWARRHHDAWEAPPAGAQSEADQPPRPSSR